MPRTKIGGLELELAEGWEEITGMLEDDPPPTVAKADGVGALQLSLATHEGEDTPAFDSDELGALLFEFGEQHHLGEPQHVTEIVEDGLTRIGGQFQANDGSFIALWYATDGKHLAYFTYFAEQKPPPEELTEATRIVASAKFGNFGVRPRA